MKLVSAVSALVVLFSLSSCSQDMMEVTYTPDNYNVTFESSSATYALEGQALVVTINRGVAKEAISVPLTLTDPNGVYSMDKRTADFAEGEYTTQVKLSYNVSDLKPVVNYAFTLSFDDAYKAVSGTNKITGSCQMPLVYRDWGKVSAYKGSFFSYVPAEKRTWDIQLADYTNNYFKIKGFFGGETDLEFNIQNGQGVVTVYLDRDPANFLFGGLNEEGTLQLNSLMQFDVYCTVSAGYFGWYTHQIYLSAVN